MNGVLSAVRSSVEEEPVSDAAARSGVGVTSGATVSTVIDMVVGTVDTSFEACELDTVQVPSSIVPRSQPWVVEVATNVHDCVAVPLEAVRVTVAPTIRLPATIAGVSSEVMLSVDDVPRSDGAVRSTVVAGSATGLVLVALIEV